MKITFAGRKLEEQIVQIYSTICSFTFFRAPFKSISNQTRRFMFNAFSFLNDMFT